MVFLALCEELQQNINFVLFFIITWEVIVLGKFLYKCLNRTQRVNNLPEVPAVITSESET